jgi:hypothetical protein
MSESSPSQLPFAEFAKAVQLSGAVNRFPALGGAADVYTYSVYMNGPLGAGLPRSVQEQTLQDVTVQALTEKYQLDPLSARDNLKVAELVALRTAWMTAVQEEQAPLLPNAVLQDYAVLSDGMRHPWIVAELSQQRELSSRLGPTLARAGVSKDVIPKEVSIGKVVAQTSDFTLQETQDGEVVTHENRRLQEVPAVGEAVMVSYYRGAGQVVDSLDKARFGDPFIDRDSEDVAVRVTTQGKGGEEQLVLFNSVQSYEKFVHAHGLDERLVQKAFDVRAMRPKSEYTAPPRDPLAPPYIDEKSGCLAVDYVQNDVAYTALFESASKLASLSQQFGLGAKAIAEAHRLQTSMDLARDNAWPAIDGQRELKDSEIDIKKSLMDEGFAFPEMAGSEARDYIGPVVAVSALHVAQDIGRRKVVIHDVRNLDKVPNVGDRLNIKVKDGRSVVTDMVKAGKDLGR